MEEGFAANPPWVVAVAAVVYACIAYLTTIAASRLVAKAPVAADAPFVMERPPIAPLLIGAALVGWSIVGRSTAPTSLVALAAMIVALSASYWTDLTRGIVTDAFTLPPLALIVALGIARQDYSPIVSALVVALPFAAAAFTTKGKGFGWGDVRLVALGGAVLGLELALIMYALTGLVACTVAVIRGKRTERIAFAPYLVAGIALGMLVPVTPHFG